MRTDRTVPVERLIEAVWSERPLLMRDSRRDRSSAGAPGEDRGIAPEPPDHAVDPEEQLPQKLRDGRETLQRAQRAARIIAGEHHGRARRDDQRSADETQPRCAS